MIDFNYWPFFFLAIFGAIVANATGAGGGVVFVPAFNILNVNEASIIATSFAIQCFGMTAGTLAWRNHALAQSVNEDRNALKDKVWLEYWPLVTIFSVPAVLGVLVGQYLFFLENVATVVVVFKGFSALFALSIIATTVYIARRKRVHQPPIQFDQALYLVAMMVGFVGGIVTAWLSIGVGELIAVMLILMRFPVRFAIGVAVSVSAICVLVGVQKYLWITPDIDLNVLFFAAPAAVIGGTVAQRVASLLSPVQLKVFIAIWVLVSAVTM